MAEVDVAPEPVVVAQPPGQRSLPFTYAQQQGVLLIDGSEGPHVLTQGQVGWQVLAELRRFLGESFTTEAVDGDEFQRRLTVAYQRDNNEAVQMAEDISADVDLSRLADEIRYPNGCPTSGEQAALALRQSKIGRLIHHPHMGRAGQFQPATNDSALQRGNDRHAAIFHFVEGLMPAQADMHEISWASVFVMVLDQIKTRTEMIARAGQHDGLDASPRGRRKEVDELLDRRDIKRVAFAGAVEGYDPDTVILRLDG